MPASLEAVYYIDRPPAYRIENGMFHIRYTVGELRYEFVMRPSVFFQAINEAAETSRKHRSRRNVADLHAATGKSSK